MKILKYQSQVELIPDCPCNGEVPPKNVFRWVNNEFLSPNDFTPTAMRNPNRHFILTDQNKCLDWGLSMYGSLEKAKEGYNSLTLAIKRKLDVKYVAVGYLDEIDGIIHRSLKPIKNHFTFYQYEDQEISSKFEVISQLK